MRVSHDELAEVPWDLVVADEAQHVKNARSSTAKALRKIPSTVRVALTGTPMENNLTELWSILDWVIPGLLGSRQAFRRVWASPIEAGVHEAKTRQFADLIGPFLLRRRKSDPGIAPELPGQDRDRPPAAPDPRAGGALRVVRPRHDGPHRAGRPRRPGHPARPGARPAHRAQADLQPPGPLPEGVGRGPAHRPLPEARPGRRAARHRAGRGRRRPRLHPVRRDGPAARGAPGQGRHPAPVPPRRHADPRARGDGGAVPGGRVAGLPALAQGRRHRPQPDRRPTTSSTSTAGGTPRSRSRPPTAPTASARPGRCRCTG